MCCMSVDVDGCAPGWLLLLVQLPRTPSSARVALWRRLRAAGATTMINGAWVLPETEPHADFLGQLRDVVLQQGGTVFVLRVSVSSPEVHDTIIRRFQADRGREYDEFAERCTALRSELDKETKAGKHTFAEMEENEQDLEKLVRWLAKIQARDFFPDERGPQSADMLTQCRSAVEAFSQAVYAAEELTDSIQPVCTENGWPGSGGANASCMTSVRCSGRLVAIPPTSNSCSARCILPPLGY
jgi:hypothetical protein